ncbi:MAG: PEP/pyruvate-binding domain-containing protein [Anaerolineaceae bacterium]|nr:PEP/pyruvate-binding domain-containing protein [Anaerolineaceae bacterium]
MSVPVLIHLQDRNLPSSIGNKANNLRTLSKIGMKIPLTYVIPWEVFDRYQAKDDSVIQELKTKITDELVPSKLYAIRSSANVEDSLQYSFAGQFKTMLNIKGVEEILSAILSIWDTTNSSSVIQYLEKLPNNPQKLQMAVIVQEMVTPEYSGVAFSRNPITGTDEIVIEAVEGIGEKLVQSGVTPYRWIHKWGKWIVKPDENIIPESVVTQVIIGTKKIVNAYKNPIDLEWVYDGNSITWVQAREITSLSNISIYSNRISKEVMPGQIKPLIWSINLPLIIPTWIDLLNELVGETHLKVEDMAKQFYYRSYFNMGAMGKLFSKAGFPSEGLEMMMGVVPKEAGRPVFKFNPGMLRLAPKLIWFFYNKWTFARRYKRDMPELIASFSRYDLADVSDLSLDQLIIEIKELFNRLQKVVFFNVHIPLLLSMYNNLLSFNLKKMGVLPEEFDFTNGIAGIENNNPNFLLRKLNQQYKQLDPETRQAIISSNFEQFIEMPIISEFKQGVLDFKQKFGHLSDNTNNFTAIPWREKPEFILLMICDYPEEDEKIKKSLQFSDLKKKPLLLNVFYKRTRVFYQYRDEVGDLYAYGYGLFRPYFLAISKIFVDLKILDEIDDIFYLDWQEIQNIADNFGQSKENKKIIQDRKIAMEESREIELPMTIFGDQPPPIISQHSSILKGVPTSPGYYSGPVRKVLGIDDFPKVKQGDVLVVPFSDIGWSPLFAKAGAVVSESGGILSHSSIIAREYKIPAVVSVPDAMKMKDNQMIVVDGYKGEIIIHE